MQILNQMYFPTNGEFISLYLGYIVLLFLLIRGIIYSRQKAFYIGNLIAFITYAFMMLTLFFDKENFKGGMSLFHLAYGWIFLLTHLVIMMLIRLGKWVYTRFRKNKE